MTSFSSPSLAVSHLSLILDSGHAQYSQVVWLTVERLHVCPVFPDDRTHSPLLRDGVAVLQFQGGLKMPRLLVPVFKLRLVGPSSPPLQGSELACCRPWPPASVSPPPGHPVALEEGSRASPTDLCPPVCALRRCGRSCGALTPHARRRGASRACWWLVRMKSGTKCPLCVTSLWFYKIVLV